MHFQPNVTRHEPDDAFDFRPLQGRAGVTAARIKTVQPEPAIGIDHDFDHQWLGDCWTKSRLQHGLAT
jgi:hypothetical protein